MFIDGRWRLLRALIVLATQVCAQQHPRYVMEVSVSARQGINLTVLLVAMLVWLESSKLYLVEQLVETVRLDRLRVPPLD